ncbi:neutral/alkaline non-lysosomal ceramidase N-terminal domain-containing protein [Gimesia aquarii]|uniref:Neutral/alkaline non-lysosomal ceramidase n=1 Tax=Gimesia aquarii TaxID=2527964 RepID=A0A517WYT8_9PLAN|nr:neutral/alkaline non-lysosomal ceramidase N-terminal domain-containing protein [Gimesia aquarii]QDU10422.1 Neutral/alkaline non-lysosomal ceramidase [Gimesia aquarii]
MPFTSRVLVLVGLFLMSSVTASGADPLEIESPKTSQVIQRTGVAPRVGFADVKVSGRLPDVIDNVTWEYRVVPLADKPAMSTAWTIFKPNRKGKKFEGTARIKAGGWYRLEVRCRKKDNVLNVGAVEPMGVGEVFLVAGQSYATNCNDERLKVTDPQQRVVAFNGAKQTWTVANDPQPAPDGSNGGSIWPPLGDALAAELQVPVGFANVGVASTSSKQWMPDGNLHPRLVSTGKALGGFRAVLWQQGESDVLGKTSTAQYVKNLQSIRNTAIEVWGFEPPWLLAKSTIHPTVYNDPAGEKRIRDAIDSLVKQPGFFSGPDTDTLKGENRGDVKSRRHFSGIGQRNAGKMWLTAIRREAIPDKKAHSGLRVGVAEVDITPPRGFPMAGYYHERLAEGSIDPLKAKAIVFRDDDTSAALVVCDLVGIATDFSKEVRQIASAKTGIPVNNIVIAATHSHTAPDYMKELYLYLGKEKQQDLRLKYIEKLIHGPVSAIMQANQSAKPSILQAGSAQQKTKVAFNRRFVMRDGSVRTWQSFSNPDVVRAAGPIDDEIGLLSIRNPEDGTHRCVLSNFALHLDTVGGTKWSADYPYFIERMLRDELGSELISIFGTGCCGDINHANPATPVRNKADFIGHSLGESISKQLSKLKLVENTNLTVHSKVVKLPLQDATREEVDRSIKLLKIANQGGKVDFFDHVTAYKKLILDQLRHHQPLAKTTDHITWGLSRSLSGIGETLPVDVTVMTVGTDVAIVCLPGEVFVELGLAIKQASPFPTTIIVELSNAVETIYIPHRAAYAGGSYEVTNSAVQPGSGEILVETALTLLRQAATENKAH